MKIERGSKKAGEQTPYENLGKDLNGAVNEVLGGAGTSPVAGGRGEAAGPQGEKCRRRQSRTRRNGRSPLSLGCRGQILREKKTFKPGTGGGNRSWLSTVVAHRRPSKWLLADGDGRAWNNDAEPIERQTEEKRKDPGEAKRRRKKTQ